MKIDEELKAVRDRRALQQQIREEFGHEKIEEARKRLCLRCSRLPGCWMLPITSSGKDCPYFEKVKEVNNAKE